jgi:hypothetical protein
VPPLLLLDYKGELKVPHAPAAHNAHASPLSLCAACVLAERRSLVHRVPRSASEHRPPVATPIRLRPSSWSKGVPHEDTVAELHRQSSLTTITVSSPSSTRPRCFHRSEVRVTKPIRARATGHRCHLNTKALPGIEPPPLMSVAKPFPPSQSNASKNRRN